MPTKGSKTTYNNFVFRRQFLLTQDTCATLNHWQYKSLGHFHLYAHPDLQLSFVSTTDSNVTVTLLGYIIDPNFPERSNTDILNEIIKFADSTDRISDYLYSVSGRFVLIVKTPKDIFLFHDPCGLRTVCYTKYKEKTFVGSQPHIFKQVMPLEDGGRLLSYNESSHAKTVLEHWIPSGCTLFEEVYHLVPNHYLRLSTLDQIRYYPKRRLPKRRLSEVVAEASELFQNMMIAANKRFKLALQITAGYDSRILLSAAKNIANEVYFYTLLYRDMHAKSNDIAIPPKLLGSLGLNHNLISCRKPVPESFRKIYEQNASPAHTDDWGKIAYGMIDTYPQNRVTVKGNCSEIAKCGKYPYGKHPPIESADQIIKIYQQQLFKLKFVRDQIHTWYNQACELPDEFNMDILDLFHWEHKHGSWQAFGQLEFDIVHETFTPFNHRGLLELMLSTPAKFRCAPNYTLYKKSLKNMWSEVLRQPLNPRPIKFRVAIHLGRMTFLAKLRFANFLRYFGVYEMAKKLYRKALRKKNG